MHTRRCTLSRRKSCGAFWNRIDLPVQTNKPKKTTFPSIFSPPMITTRDNACRRSMAIESTRRYFCFMVRGANKLLSLDGLTHDEWRVMPYMIVGKKSSQLFLRKRSNVAQVVWQDSCSTSSLCLCNLASWCAGSRQRQSQPHLAIVRTNDDSTRVQNNEPVVATAEVLESQSSSKQASVVKNAAVSGAAPSLAWSHMHAWHAPTFRRAVDTKRVSLDTVQVRHCHDDRCEIYSCKERHRLGSKTRVFESCLWCTTTS